MSVIELNKFFISGSVRPEIKANQKRPIDLKPCMIAPVEIENKFEVAMKKL